MLSPRRRDTWAAERPGEETWVKAAAALRSPQLCRAHISAIAFPHFGVTATHRSPDPSRPGCEGLRLYFQPFRQVTPWLSMAVSISSLNLLSHTSALLQGPCSSSFSRALVPSTNGFISSFIKKSFKRKTSQRTLYTPHLHPAQCTEILVWRSIARSRWLHQGQNLSYALQVKAHIISVADRVGIMKALKKKPNPNRLISISFPSHMHVRTKLMTKYRGMKAFGK